MRLLSPVRMGQAERADREIRSELTSLPSLLGSLHCRASVAHSSSRHFIAELVPVAHSSSRHFIVELVPVALSSSRHFIAESTAYTTSAHHVSTCDNLAQVGYLSSEHYQEPNITGPLKEAYSVINCKSACQQLLLLGCSCRF